MSGKYTLPAGFTLREVLRHILRRTGIAQIQAGGAARHAATALLEQNVEDTRASWSILTSRVPLST